MMKEEILVIIFMFCMSIILASYILCGWGRPGRPSLYDSGTNKENTMSKENIQLVVALIISIGFLFYVTTTSSDIKFPPPPIELMGAG